MMPLLETSERLARDQRETRERIECDQRKTKRDQREMDDGKTYTNKIARESEREGWRKGQRELEIQGVPIKMLQQPADAVSYWSIFSGTPCRGKEEIWSYSDDLITI